MQNAENSNRLVPVAFWRPGVDRSSTGDLSQGYFSKRPRDQRPLQRVLL